MHKISIKNEFRRVSFDSRLEVLTKTQWSESAREDTIPMICYFSMNSEHDVQKKHLLRRIL